MATGIGRPSRFQLRQWAAPSWCRCQCIATRSRPSSCTRYIPMLWLAGRRAWASSAWMVCTPASVMYRPWYRSAHWSGSMAGWPSPRHVRVGLLGVAHLGQVAVHRPAAQDRQLGQVHRLAGADHGLHRSLAAQPFGSDP
ncbi:MAG: hypothetical protein KatS3mg103_0417 [Phycisphaerales bacterium]|nr:MAG: hypothetical protein KatS3mg103_0417 [Phycisphaerales bacterium]